MVRSFFVIFQNLLSFLRLPACAAVFLESLLHSLHTFSFPHKHKINFCFVSTGYFPFSFLLNHMFAMHSFFITKLLRSSSKFLFPMPFPFSTSSKPFTHFSICPLEFPKKILCVWSSALCFKPAYYLHQFLP